MNGQWQHMWFSLRISACWVAHRAERLPRPSLFATPCKVFTGLAPPSLAPALPPFPFLPGLADLLLALSPSPLVVGGRERYTSRAARPLRPRSCRLLISLSCSESCADRQRENTQLSQRLRYLRLMQMFFTDSSNTQQTQVLKRWHDIKPKIK